MSSRVVGCRLRWFAQCQASTAWHMIIALFAKLYGAAIFNEPSAILLQICFVWQVNRANNACVNVGLVFDLPRMPLVGSCIVWAVCCMLNGGCSVTRAICLTLRAVRWCALYAVWSLRHAECCTLYLLSCAGYAAVRRFLCSVRVICCQRPESCPFFLTTIVPCVLCSLFACWFARQAPWAARSIRFLRAVWFVLPCCRLCAVTYT